MDETECVLLSKSECLYMLFPQQVQKSRKMSFVWSFKVQAHFVQTILTYASGPGKG